MNSTSGIKVDMVSMEDAMADPSAAFTQTMDSEPSVDAIPDLVALTNNLIDIIEYLNQPDVQEICRSNDSVIRMALINKYADIVPLKFIDLFMEKDPVHRQESIDRAMRWIEALSKVKSGEADLETVSKGLVEEINERYAYRKYGSKEAFERALQTELASEQKKIAKSKARGV